MDPTPDPPLQRIQYKPLDASRNEIRVLSFETSSRPDDLSGRLDRILGLGPARLTLEHVSLDDWKPEYVRFRTKHPTQWSSSQVCDAWCEQLEIEPRSAASDVFRTVARFTWGDYTAISYMRDSPEKTKTITINGMPVVIGTNLAAAIDCLRSRPLCKIWVDAVCINQDDVNERNAHVMRIREIFGQSFAVTVWLGEDEMSSTGLNSWVEETLDKLRCCGTILAAHDKRTLEAALGIDVRAWESDHDYDELEDFFSSDVLYFDNEWWADSDDEDEFGPPHFRDLVAMALLRLFQNPYWSRLWTIQELAVSPRSSTLRWGNSSVSVQTVLTLADIFCKKFLDDGTLDSHLVNEISPCLHLLNSIGQWQRSGVLSNREDGLKGTALADLCRWAGSAKCDLPHDKVFGLLGLLPQAISGMITIDYNQDETKLLSEFTVAISMASGNSENSERTGDGKTQSTANSPMYALQDAVGKGKGLFATEKISKGTRILSEEAVITLSEQVSSERLGTSIRQQVDALSEHQRQAFLSMHNIHPYKNTTEQCLGIFRTNSLPAEAVGGKGGIFLEACRINHACDNNAQKNWNDTIKRHTVHALRDIDKGEEITLTYLSPLKNRKTRQKILLERFGFICLCRLCSLPPEQSQESDRRLEEIHRLDGVIDQLGTEEGLLVSPLRTLGYLDRQVRLYSEQGREDVGFAQAVVNAAQLVIANSDLARGRILAERAASVWKSTLGGDSTQAIKYRALAQDPSKYELYGFSMKWKTKVDEETPGLGPSDLEDWLWRREKATAPRQLANPRSRLALLRFIDLPDEKGVDADFYERGDTGTYRPRRHWCFLGEIVDFTTLHHLEIEVKDVSGGKIPLHFYTNGLGSEMTPDQYRKGYTVAILYAKRHVFRFGEPGIRHEDPRMIKVRLPR